MERAFRVEHETAPYHGPPRMADLLWMINCGLGGGRGGGPARTRVQELLREGGQALNCIAHTVGSRPAWGVTPRPG